MNCVCSSYCICQRPAPAPPEPVTLQTEPHLVTAAIISAIIDSEPLAMVYKSASGRTTIRYVIPRSIERCDNGNTIMRAHDLQHKSPRSFTLDNIRAAGPAF